MFDSTDVTNRSDSIKTPPRVPRAGRALRRTAGVLAGALGAVALAMAPAASAAPSCTQTGTYTTLCQTPGSSQIVTSPAQTNNGYFGGYPFGGYGFGIFPFGF